MQNPNRTLHRSIDLLGFSQKTPDRTSQLVEEAKKTQGFRRIPTEPEEQKENTQKTPPSQRCLALHSSRNCFGRAVRPARRRTKKSFASPPLDVPAKKDAFREERRLGYSSRPGYFKTARTLRTESADLSRAAFSSAVSSSSITFSIPFAPRRVGTPR